MEPKRFDKQSGKSLNLVRPQGGLECHINSVSFLFRLFERIRCGKREKLSIQQMLYVCFVFSDGRDEIAGKRMSTKPAMPIVTFFKLHIATKGDDPNAPWNITTRMMGEIVVNLSPFRVRFRVRHLKKTKSWQSTNSPLMFGSVWNRKMCNRDGQSSFECGL
jgi:hypothetical protein